MNKVISVGQKAEISKLITEEDVFLFADLVKDNNPIHLDKNFAKNTLFGRRVVHGMFGASLISSVLGTKLPGPGAIYLGQTLNFENPIFLNDTIRAEVKVIEVRNDKPIITLDTICLNQLDEINIKGRAVIKI